MKREIHHKIAGIIINNGQVLMCRKYDEPHFIMPGGKRNKGETKRKTLERELQEELQVKLKSMEYFGIHEAPHFREKNKLVRMELYIVDIEGEPRATSEINEILWLDSSYRQKGIKIASINEDYTIPELKRRGLID